MDAVEQLHCVLRPDAPMPQQTALDAHSDSLASALESERGEQVEHDVIVVTGIERDALLGFCRDHAAHYIERAVAVKRCHLDRHHVVNCGKALPEARWQMNATDGRLQIK